MKLFRTLFTLAPFLFLLDSKISASTLQEALNNGPGTYEISEDTNGDGSIDTTGTITIGENEMPSFISLDTNGDGKTDVFGSSKQTESGSVFSMTVTTPNPDGNGESKYITEHSYDSDGKNLTAKTDQNGDGNFDHISHFDYDEKNRVISAINDFDADGQNNAVSTFTYEGDQEKPSSSSYDNDGDGKADSISYATYDEQGRELSNSEDRDGDGKIDWVLHYAYDGEGSPRTLYRSEAIEGTDRMRTYTYVYDESKNPPELLKLLVDEDGDGKVDHEESFAEEPLEPDLVENEENLFEKTGSIEEPSEDRSSKDPTFAESTKSQTKDSTDTKSIKPDFLIQNIKWIGFGLLGLGLLSGLFMLKRRK